MAVSNFDQMKPDNIPDLYSLSQFEFEELCVDLFSDWGQYHSVIVDSRPRDRGYIAQGIRDDSSGKPDFLIVKHLRHLGPAEVERGLQGIPVEEIRQIILMTSASLSDQEKAQVKVLFSKIQIYDRTSILKVIHDHENLQRYFRLAERRRLRQRRRLLFSSLLALASVLGIFFTLVSYIPIDRNKKHLGKKIEAVDRSLQGLKDLETYLGDIREEMKDTKSAMEEIEKEYARTQELKNMTGEEVQALRAVLEARRPWVTVFGYFLSFVLGIASSVIATIFYDRLKTRRRLAASWEGTPAEYWHHALARPEDFEECDKCGRNVRHRELADIGVCLTCWHADLNLQNRAEQGGSFNAS